VITQAPAKAAKPGAQAPGASRNVAKGLPPRPRKRAFEGIAGRPLAKVKKTRGRPKGHWHGKEAARKKYERAVKSGAIPAPIGDKSGFRLSGANEGGTVGQIVTGQLDTPDLDQILAQHDQDSLIGPDQREHLAEDAAIEAGKRRRVQPAGASPESKDDPTETEDQFQRKRKHTTKPGKEKPRRVNLMLCPEHGTVTVRETIKARRRCNYQFLLDCGCTRGMNIRTPLLDGSTEPRT
jgi:hypothetical protein